MRFNGAISVTTQLTRPVTCPLIRTLACPLICLSTLFILVAGVTLSSQSYAQSYAQVETDDATLDQEVQSSENAFDAAPSFESGTKPEPKDKKAVAKELPDSETVAEPESSEIPPYQLEKSDLDQVDHKIETANPEESALKIETAEEYDRKKQEQQKSYRPDPSKMNKNAVIEHAPVAPTPVVELGPKKKFVPQDLGPAGGSYKAYHPDARKGLLRIEKDGSYQYKITLKKKSQAGSFRVGQIAPPSITGASGKTSYKGVYNNKSMNAFFGDYEYYPFQKYGALGLQLGMGFASVSGNGVLNDGANSQAQEVYKMYVIPVSAFIVYRLEFWRRQFFVPYVSGGGTVFGLYESRDDSKKPALAWAPAAGGAVGMLFNISRWDPRGSFTMNSDYGVSDLWITMEARYLAGLKKDLDFTTSILSMGITVDY